MSQTELPDTVKLISSDGFEFIISKRCALASGTIKAMVASSGQYVESSKNEIQFQDISAVILDKVCRYLYYKVKYTNTSSELPQFPIEPELALDLLMAADYLDV